MSNDDDKEAFDDHIDRNLKKVYEDVLNEELPDRFKDLLAQLKQETAKNTPEAEE